MGGKFFHNMSQIFCMRRNLADIDACIVIIYSWHVYVGKQRRVTVISRLVADNVVFLVHALQEPYPERGSTVLQSASQMSLPCLSVRGDFVCRKWFAFDCSDLSIERKVARSVGPPVSR
jgi:hypothetical protein